MAQSLKRLPGMWETRVRSLGWGDPLEKEMATHSSTLAWRIPWREEPGRLQSMGSQRVGHDWATLLTLLYKETEPLILLFFKDYFLCEPFSKFFYWNCYNISSVLCFGFWPWGMWDLSFPIRDRTCTPCIGKWSLNHWTTREIPRATHFKWL